MDYFAGLDGRYRADWRNNHSYLTLHQIRRHFPKPAIFTVRPAEFDRDILALSVAGLGKTLSKCREQASAWFRRAGMQEADYRHLLLLRSCSQRLRCRGAEQRDELAPPHSITSSAVARSVGGTFTPSDFAVFEFTISSKRVGRSAGKSAGLVPFRILATIMPASRYCSSILGP